MKHLQGKKVKVTSINGNSVTGLVTGAADDIVKILVDGQQDQTVIFIKNIFTYQVIGQGVTGGYSGIHVFACKNLEIGCKGRLRLSCKKDTTILDMGCQVAKQPTKFKCDFGCLGEMQVLPSRVQKILFDGLTKKNGKEEK